MEGFVGHIVASLGVEVAEDDCLVCGEAKGLAFVEDVVADRGEAVRFGPLLTAHRTQVRGSLHGKSPIQVELFHA